MKKAIKRTIAYVMAVSLLLSCLTGCTTWDNFSKAFLGRKEPEKETIKIGIFEPLSGEFADEASEEIRGITVANKIYGSVLNKEIELVYADNKSNKEDAIKAASDLAAQGVSVVLGSYGNILTIAAGDIFKEEKIPAIAITCTNPLITRTNEFYARACYIDSFEARGAAEYLISGAGIKKAAILYDIGDDYGKAKATEFAEYFTNHVADGIVETAEFEAGSEDFTDILNRLFELQVEAVYLPGTKEQADPIITQARMLKYNFIWMGTAKWEGIEHEDVYYTVDYDSAISLSAISQSFRDAYIKEYGTSEKASEQAALGFDAYILALAAIREAGTADDGPLLAETITKIEGLAGATGYITMDKYGDPIKGIVIKKIQDGKAKTVFTSTPAEIDAQK